MNRRGFLAAMLAAAVAPAVVKAASLMPVRQLASGIVVPELFTGELGMYRGMRFTVPEGVTHVWMTCVGPSIAGVGQMVSPYENAAGDVFNKPLRVHPGQNIPVKVGRHSIFQWIDPKVGTLEAHSFTALHYPKDLAFPARTVHAPKL